MGNTGLEDGHVFGIWLANVGGGIWLASENCHAVRRKIFVLYNPSVRQMFVLYNRFSEMGAFGWAEIGLMSFGWSNRRACGG